MLAALATRSASIVPCPGSAPRPATLQARLQAALDAMPPGYEPRTEHREADGYPRYLNRLILETSPYLLQHAHNPVDWHSWGDEAFELAAAEDRPVFLSIGYSTCHWCHVMERESFDHPEVARRMNEMFVCIKVDREQRPDVDDIYMTAVQVTRQQGGWPMSSFLLPDRRPFFGATYFPPRQFVDVMQQVDLAWRERRADLEAAAERITDLVRQLVDARGASSRLGREAVDQAVDWLVAQTDRALGGFGGAPKFPNETNLILMLEHALRTGDRAPLDAALVSLRAMAQGGIHDQVGGGFHRYSVDSRWLVPHFEKMLYNQAHLLRAYVLAFRLTGDPLLARVARETADYVLRDMTSVQGAFFSATDADSEADNGESVEGEFFVWTPEQLREALAPPDGEQSPHADTAVTLPAVDQPGQEPPATGRPATLPEPDDADLAMRVFGVTDEGNFEGRTIPCLDRPLDETAAALGMPIDDLLSRLDGIRERLYQVRERRPHPLRDEKVLTSWNGMMIRALADAAGPLGEPRYARAAKRAAECLWGQARREDGGLWRVSLDGNASTPGLLQDYAHAVQAFVGLFDATENPLWLERASRIAAEMVERFDDAETPPGSRGPGDRLATEWRARSNGFVVAEPAQSSDLIARPRSPSDGAVPSGNSVAIRALAELGRRNGDRGLIDRALAAVASFGASIERMPAAHTYMLTGLASAVDGDAGPRGRTGVGAVTVTGRLQPPERASSPGDLGKREVVLDLAIDDHWHVTGCRPGTAAAASGSRDGRHPAAPADGKEELVGIRVEGVGDRFEIAGAVNYPEPPVLEGHQHIAFTIQPSPQGQESPSVSIPVSLHLQACKDELCMPAESVVLQIPLAEQEV